MKDISVEDVLNHAKKIQADWLTATLVRGTSAAPVLQRYLHSAVGGFLFSDSQRVGITGEN